MSDEDQSTREPSAKSRAFGCAVALALPLAVLIAFFGVCTVGEGLQGEQQVARFILAFLVLFPASVVLGVLLLVWSPWTARKRDP